MVQAPPCHPKCTEGKFVRTEQFRYFFSIPGTHLWLERGNPGWSCWVAVEAPSAGGIVDQAPTAQLTFPIQYTCKGYYGYFYQFPEKPLQWLLSLH